MEEIEHTISFRQDMVDLILSGKKTLTIRPIKPQPELSDTLTEGDLFSRKYCWRWNGDDLSERGREWFCRQYPHGRVGDVISVREQPEIMLKIVGIGAIQLFDVKGNTWEKAGVVCDPPKIYEQSYHCWRSFYGDSEFDWFKNPWVWIIGFELMENVHK